MKSLLTLMCLMAAIVLCAGSARAEDSPFSDHPAAAELARVFAAQEKVSDFKPSGFVRSDYLRLIADDIDYWTKHQNPAGAIIDPYEKAERQYSTPAFAYAAALLVNEAGRDDLLGPASRAMTWATHSLAIGKAADWHGDFFMPMLIHARRQLKTRVSPEQLAAWDKDLRSIIPEKAYNMGLKGMNWNIVSSSGELLRRQDGLVVPEQRDAQMKYLNERLADHAGRYFTEFGMYADPGQPLCYDIFSRLWLGDMMAHGAYDGPTSKRLADFLRVGGFSTILMLCPSGEWPNGGRSALHNWTEAEAIAVCEMHATQWSKAGQPQIAGAFKRAAHLAYESMLRWQRPSGELWIIKNRYEPEKRFAFERYSNHSQYNTLPMAMLAMAFEHADDAIVERPAPAEVGGYVFDLREKFHKIIAAAGGYYVEIETTADPHYNATGLQRIHRTGVKFPPFSDTAVAHCDYGANDGAGETLSPGIQWKLKGSISPNWESLGEATWRDEKKPIESQPGGVREAQLKVDTVSPTQAKFTVSWSVVANGADRKVVETYDISSAGVECTSEVSGDAVPAATRLVIPALMFDGVDKTNIKTGGKKGTIEHRGSVLTWQVESDAGNVRLDGPQVPAHNGMMQVLVADLPKAATQARWRVTLEQK